MLATVFSVTPAFISIRVAKAGEKLKLSPGVFFESISVLTFVMFVTSPGAILVCDEFLNSCK